MNLPTRILLLEDDPKLANEIKQYFVSKGIMCDVAFDGSLLMKMKKLHSYNIYVLDINVPAFSGLEVCYRIRKEDKNTPILMLTAFGDVSDKIEAFQLGADDYMVKPFHFDELIARINALIRRSANPQNEGSVPITIGDLVINVDKVSVNRGKKVISLTPKEFKLLALLANARGKPVSKQTISEQVWDQNLNPAPNTIEVYINFLRNKIDKGFSKKLIHTKVGFGYYLKNE